MVAKKGETPAAPLAFWQWAALGFEARLLSLPGMETCSLMQVWFGSEFGDASSMKMLQGWLGRCSAEGGRAVNWTCKTWREWEPTNLVLTAGPSVGKQNHDGQVSVPGQKKPFHPRIRVKKMIFFPCSFCKKRKVESITRGKTCWNPPPCLAAPSKASAVISGGAGWKRAGANWDLCREIHTTVFSS